MSVTNVPFVDLKANLKPLREDILKNISAVLDKCNFILGDEVQSFENNFARYCGAKHCLGVANGTDAIHLALKATGIGAGDEAIVPAHTFIATALGVSYTGAKPVLVDVDPANFLMDPKKLEAAITPRTKAIVPVHLYGRMVDMKPIMEIAAKHKLKVIEDTAQAHGATLNGQKAGNVGDIGCYSFYPGKNLGAFGDGGAITTNSDEFKASVEALRNYGSAKKYHHPIVGFNSRLDTIQATILGLKLPHLNSYNERRYDTALKYNSALEGVGDIVLPQIPLKGSHVFHLYVIRTQKRDALCDYLNANGVGAVIHYPKPIHYHGAFENLGYKKGSFPISEQITGEIVSLPIFPEITDAQISQVTDTVKSFFKKA